MAKKKASKKNPVKVPETPKTVEEPQQAPPVQESVSPVFDSAEELIADLKTETPSVSTEEETFDTNGAVFRVTFIFHPKYRRYVQEQFTDCLKELERGLPTTSITVEEIPDA